MSSGINPFPSRYSTPTYWLILIPVLFGGAIGIVAIVCGLVGAESQGSKIAGGWFGHIAGWLGFGTRICWLPHPPGWY